MALFDYMREVTRYLRDDSQQLMNPADLKEFINRARRQVARQAQCIRVVPPVSGQITTITVTDGGSGYTSPTVTITAPDFPSGAKLFPNGAQALATATVIGGVITSISVDFGGDGYFQPQVTITDSTGTGAVATAQTSPINITVMGQEIYSFSDFPLQNFPGVKSVMNVISVSFLYANWRYSTLSYSFSEYQAKVRRYPRNYVYVPAVISQLGQGEAGSLYMYPLPNAAYQFEADCICNPIDLLTDDSVEAIPDPWTDAVPLLAAYYCYISLQNLNTASFFLNQFDTFMLRYSASARPGRASNMYGRYVVPLLIGGGGMALSLLAGGGLNGIIT